MSRGARETGPALEARYRFLLWLAPAAERFPRNRKFLPGGGLRRRLRRAQGMPPDAPGRRAVRVDKHDRRLFTPTPWGSPSWKRGPPFRPGAEAGSTTLTEKHYIRGMRQMRLRLGLVTVVAMALGCLRAERQGGHWLARSGCATDRGGRPTDRPPPETGCLRPRPGSPRVCGAVPQRPDILPLFQV